MFAPQFLVFILADAMKFMDVKPIGVATTAQSFIRKSDENNLAGVVFATNNPNFGKDFIKAIAKQRFWNQT